MARRLLFGRPMIGATARSPWRALVAEDDADMRAIVAQTLRSEGFTTEEVADGRRLWVQTIQSGPYDLVVSDMRLPIVDGLTVIEDLRARDSRSAIVLMTGFGDDTLRARAASLNVVFLSKPFPMTALRATARRVREEATSRGTP